ncbi:hypothetical protein [uncultured Desulfuromonas sp.]|uniref:hypothetical protein n=1 Tax=uncultured Desulfuromonas sp. TaxID=181013 RepID=UPI002AAADB2A|nr:hypothetical protein [uncultured Desulfuromonas sp.]
MSAKLAQSASVLKQVADDHRADRSLRSVLLNGRAWLLNDTLPQGWAPSHPFERCHGRNRKRRKMLSTFCAKDDALHDSST